MKDGRRLSIEFTILPLRFKRRKFTAQRAHFLEPSAGVATACEFIHRRFDRLPPP